MALEGKRVLVTGASGFVGGHLVRRLKGLGAEVLAVDARDENPTDIRDWSAVKAFGDTMGRVDLVYHLAALMFVPFAFENPRETYEVNVLGTLNVLELCRLWHVEKLVFASTYVYGQPRYLPVDEDHPVNPHNPYARSKVLGEGLCRAYHEDHGLKCTILRPFNIYGEGQGEDFLVPSILRQLPGGRVELADPDPRRDLVHVADAVEAYLKAGEYRGPGFDVFNIGSGVSHSIAEIVSRVLEAWGQEVEVAYTGRRRRNEVMDVVASTAKAEKGLGWRPQVDLIEGLKRYIRWFRSDSRNHPNP